MLPPHRAWVTEARHSEASVTFDLGVLQKMVGKGEDQEYSLHNRVKNAEYARQKQEQRVRKLNQQLMELKRKNAVKIKNEMTEVERSEKELEQQLLREQAELTKVTMMR